MCMSGFSLLEDCGPPQYPKNSIISPTWRIPHHNLITHPVFSITKESNCQDNSSSNFPPTPSKTLQQKNFQLLLKLVSATFYQFFIFSPSDSPLKTLKNPFYLI